ncbi:MAG: hypothetical protein IPL59_21370 [Candidatus Competibacteraceae bacterium]|nr:hypothetical protein [Candidatus Competibacteraceae bacterium]
MTKTIPTLWFVTLISIPITLLAGGRGDAILGGAVGGALGAAVGSELGGRDGAIVGSAIGGRLEPLSQPSATVARSAR